MLVYLCGGGLTLEERREGVKDIYVVHVVFLIPRVYMCIQENAKLLRDMAAMEKAVTERLGYLQRYKVRCVCV